jgi:hypothetical protein
MKISKARLTKKRFSPLPLQKKGNISASEKAEKLGNNGRFPWIHREELGASDAFHFKNVLLLMNHAADPRWRESQAIWWFFQGSGGDNHFMIFCCKLSPAKKYR